jgi:hypothetical protein
LIEPRIYGAERFRIELVQAMAPFPALFHQMSSAKNAQMLGNGRPRDGKRPGNVPCGTSARTQQVQNGAAGWVGQGAEGRVASEA